MKFTDEVQQRVIAALVERLPEKRLICPLCKHEEWILTNGFIIFPVQEQSDVLDLSVRLGVLVVVLSCTTCGNTLFFNTINLGLRDLFKDQTYVDTDIKVKF